MWRRNSEEIAPGSDDVLVSISQVIEQDVNIFDGAELLATSERDLFSSGFLPTRTPDEVYRAIVLDRLPSFVDEDQIGTVPYIIAAAPVRVAERDRILTVPLASASARLSARSTTSIAACTSLCCASSSSAPPSACRSPSALPTPSAG